MTRTPTIPGLLLMRFAYYRRLSPEDRATYRRSDATTGLQLPEPQVAKQRAASLAKALRSGKPQEIANACAALTRNLSGQFGVPSPTVVIFDEPRPDEGDGELHGLYESDPPQATISIWIRTAKRKQLIAYKTLLRTLLHELCHHLDFTLLGLEESFHTAGFFQRESDLYRQVLPEDLS